MKTSASFIIKLFIITIFTLGILLISRVFIIEGFKVGSASMLPTLKVDTIVWTNKLHYHFSPPKKGEIVIFNHPSTNELYVKRIIALGGDSVMILGRKIWVNGELLEMSESAKKTSFQELIEK